MPEVVSRVRVIGEVITRSSLNLSPRDLRYFLASIVCAAIIQKDKDEGHHLLPAEFSQVGVSISRVVIAVYREFTSLVVESFGVSY